jgi:CubicO group peptidase (beta-lactamase class C family)
MTIFHRLSTTFVASSCAAALSLCLLGPAVADDLATAGDPDSLGFSRARLARISTWYQSRVDTNDLPGAVVAIAKGGKLAYLQAIGFQDRAKTIPMRPDSIFWIASMTKPVTSAAAMMLVDDGRLELDAPVGRYLPELANMRRGIATTDPANGSTEVTYEAPTRSMTVRDLLRHTSGLVYSPQYADAPINRLYRQVAFAAGNTLAEFVASLAALPLAHQPGEVWEYSFSVDVLARVVEVASGHPFDQFLQSRLFAPLRMIDTGFHVPAEKLGRLVDAPGPRPPHFDVTRPRKLLSGGGGLASTAQDYLRFCQMLLNGGELEGTRILSEDSVKQMTTDALPPIIKFVGEAVGPDAGAGFGLGFAIRTQTEFSNVPGSFGSYTWSGLWGTKFWVDPVEQMIAIQMIQVLPQNAGVYHTAMRNLIYGALRERAPAITLPAVAVSAGTLAAYAGTYDFGLSSSSRDRIGPASSFAGIGARVQLASSGVRLDPLENSAAAAAGLKSGDVVTRIDDLPALGLGVDGAVARLRGPVNSEVRLTITRQGHDQPIEITVTRAPIFGAVVLQVRLDGEKLVIEATGAWPVLDFERGKPLAVTAASDSEFHVEGGDRTRIAFERDSESKVSGMVLNAGPFEQKGVLTGRRPSW